jgi:hypothetical protein
MSSIATECTELKKEYESCFNQWYSEKFLKGSVEMDCEDIFRLYRACVRVMVPSFIMIETYQRQEIGPNVRQ